MSFDARNLHPEPVGGFTHRGMLNSVRCLACHNTKFQRCVRNVKFMDEEFQRCVRNVKIIDELSQRCVRNVKEMHARWDIMQVMRQRLRMISYIKT